MYHSDRNKSVTKLIVIQPDWNQKYLSTTDGFEDDDDALLDALKADATESQLTDILDDHDDFPFPKDDTPQSDEDKKCRILAILKLIHSDPTCFIKGIPIRINKSLFDGITEDDIKETQDLYQSQVPSFCNLQFLEDEGLLRVLTVGRKHSIDYALHLCDDYSRSRIKHAFDAKGNYKKLR